MSEMSGGVFVTRTDAEDGWEPDDEVGGSVHMLFEDGEVMGGLWRADDAVANVPLDVELHARETIVVLSGTVRIEVAGGPTLQLGVGDIASLPKGAATTWLTSPDFKEVWVYS